MSPASLRTMPRLPDDERRRAADLLRLLGATDRPWVAELTSAPKRLFDADGDLIGAGDTLEAHSDEANLIFAAHAPSDLALLLADEAERAAGKDGLPERDNPPRRRREIGIRCRQISVAPWRFTSSANDVAIHAADGSSVMRLVPDALGDLHAELLCTAVELLPILLARSNAAALARRHAR